MLTEFDSGRTLNKTWNMKIKLQFTLIVNFYTNRLLSGYNDHVANLSFPSSYWSTTRIDEGSPINIDPGTKKIFTSPKKGNF